MVYSRELRVPMLTVSDPSPRNLCALSAQQLAELSSSEECQTLMRQLEAAVLDLPEHLLPRSARVDRLSQLSGERGGGSLQFGWYKPTKSDSLRLRPANFDPELAAVREPLFELNKLFGGFTSAVINVGLKLGVHVDDNDVGASIGLTLGQFQGGRLVVDIPSEKKGTSKLTPFPNGGARSSQDASWYLAMSVKAARWTCCASRLCFTPTNRTAQNMWLLAIASSFASTIAATRPLTARVWPCRSAQAHW